MYINAKKAYHMATYHNIPYTSYKNSMNMYELDCRYIGPASQLSVQTSHQFHQHCQPQIPNPKSPRIPTLMVSFTEGSGAVEVWNESKALVAILPRARRDFSGSHVNFTRWAQYPNPTSYTWNSGAPINERKEIGNWGHNP